MPMKEYRKRPVVIQAIQYTPGNYDEILKLQEIIPGKSNQFVHVMTLEGRMECPIGNWLIRGVAGELYSIAPAIFDKTYELSALNGAEV